MPVTYVACLISAYMSDMPSAVCTHAEKHEFTNIKWRKRTYYVVCNLCRLRTCWTTRIYSYV